MSIPPVTRSRGNTAPWLTVPTSEAISVEHPCIIKHLEKAIDMIGGGPAVAQALDENSGRTFSLSFHPQDPAARTIVANKKQANNVLLRIAVPKRTGRKRKRGSNDPWDEDLTVTSPKKDASYLVHSMHDNPDSYTVKALAGISSMHLWRNMPDLVYSTSQNTLLQDVKSKIMSQHYPAIKDFRLPRTYGLEDTTTLPPPIWTASSIPNNYVYRQNPSVKVASDPLTGKAVVRNTQTTAKLFCHQMQWDSPEYPSTTMDGLQPLDQQSRTFQKTVTALQALFDQRPIWTRRALLNSLESELSSFNVVRFCLPYVSYALRSGPWRDAYVRLGVDPRADPQYRIYQTIMLQLKPKMMSKGLAPLKGGREYSERMQKSTAKSNATHADPDTPATQDTPSVRSKEKLEEYQHTYARFWSRSNDPTSHIFDGVSPLPPDGKVWQLCDMTDPQLAALREISEQYIRKECERRYFGWYANGTNAKMRVALKAKVDALMDGTPLDASALELFLKLPEEVGLGPYETTRPDQLTPSPPGSLGDSRARNRSEDPLAAVVAGQNAETDVEQGARVLPKSNESTSVYLGDNPTRQQLDWAALYRSFARTLPGEKPGSGGTGYGRVVKPRPKVRKSHQRKAKQKPVQAVQQPTDAETAQATAGDNQTEPIDIDAGGSDQGEYYEEGPELEDGEEIFPSIEYNGYDVDEGDDDELGLDADLDVKLEGDDDFDVDSHRLQGEIDLEEEAQDE